jgi:hypothetical protein
MTRTRLFGTLFYANYLTRALALYRSLERHFAGEFTLVMLCMDEAALRIIEALRLPRAEAVPVGDLERRDAGLRAVKAERSVAEYSWTCAPALLLYLLDQVRADETVAYLDADLMFFSDPQPIFDEWGAADILIHEHRFAPQHRHMESASGVFNVGFVGIRHAPQGRRCLERWRDQCIEACCLDPERGLCGDQKYLDEWPALYDRLHILQHKGAGLAPWNVDRYVIAEGSRLPQVDGLPLVFYHFHALRIVHDAVLGHIAIIPSYGYRFSALQRRLIYQPYARALRAAYKDVRGIAAGSGLPANRPSFAQLRETMRRGDVLFCR